MDRNKTQEGLEQDATTRAVVGGAGGHKINLPKGANTWLGWLAVVILLLVALLLYRHYYQETTSDQLSGTICNDSLSSEAATQHRDGYVSALGDIVTRFKQAPHYDRDANCLYILAEYQIDSEDLKAAQTTVDHLKSTYGPDQPFSKKLDDGRASLAGLERQLKDAQQVQKNSEGRILPQI